MLAIQLKTFPATSKSVKFSMVVLDGHKIGSELFQDRHAVIIKSNMFIAITSVSLACTLKAKSDLSRR